MIAVTPTANDYHIVCVPHPYGPDGNSCSDFSPLPDLERKQFIDFLCLQRQNRQNVEDTDEPFSNWFDVEPDEDQWQPDGAFFVNGELVLERDRSFYNGEEIIQPHSHWTPEEQLWLLDHHPMFTGRCPECETEMEKDYTARVHFDCPACG